MRIHLLCVSKRPTPWAAAASDDYLRRLSGQLQIVCRDIKPGGAANKAERMEKEARRIEKALPNGAYLVVLDERGEQWSTFELAAEMNRWRERHSDVVCVIGGADGLAPRFLNSADRAWALSKLTLPHQLARVVVIEQFYRGWTIMNNHPYHRE